jgi:hypothetical protein
VLAEKLTKFTVQEIRSLREWQFDPLNAIEGGYKPIGNRWGENTPSRSPYLQGPHNYYQTPPKVVEFRVAGDAIGQEAYLAQTERRVKQKNVEIPSLEKMLEAAEKKDSAEEEQDSDEEDSSAVGKKDGGRPERSSHANPSTRSSDLDPSVGNEDLASGQARLLPGLGGHGYGISPPMMRASHYGHGKITPLEAWRREVRNKKKAHSLKKP